MSEYIRREDASNWLKQYGQDVLHGKYKFSLMYIWKNIMDLPSANVVPVRFGEWLDGYKMQTCSLCKCRGKKSWTFCPHCGARMIYGERKE